MGGENRLAHLRSDLVRTGSDCGSEPREQIAAGALHRVHAASDDARGEATPSGVRDTDPGSG